MRNGFPPAAGLRVLREFSSHPLLTANDLAARFEITPAAAHHHLKQLKQLGAVDIGAEKIRGDKGWARLVYEATGIGRQLWSIALELGQPLVDYMDAVSKQCPWPSKPELAVMKMLAAEPSGIRVDQLLQNVPLEFGYAKVSVRQARAKGFVQISRSPRELLRRRCSITPIGDQLLALQRQLISRCTSTPTNRESIVLSSHSRIKDFACE